MSEVVGSPYKPCYAVNSDDTVSMNFLLSEEIIKMEEEVTEERIPKANFNSESKFQREADGDVHFHCVNEENTYKQSPRSEETVEADLNTGEDSHLLLQKGRVFEDRKAVILFMDALCKSKKTAFVITNSSTKNSTNLIYSCKHGKKRPSESKGKYLYSRR